MIFLDHQHKLLVETKLVLCYQGEQVSAMKRLIELLQKQDWYAALCIYLSPDCTMLLMSFNVHKQHASFGWPDAFESSLKMVVWYCACIASKMFLTNATNSGGT